MLYINGIGNISPQQTIENERFLEEIFQQKDNCLSCVEPDYSRFIHPRKARRMSRIIKMGMYAASICLEESKVKMPDAIMVGTGLGCLENTEKFLDTIYENAEKHITPTQFIQSTHNTISSTIALSLKCYNYNFTYVHRGFSFESCIQDAMMWSVEHPGSNILIGGIDEITEHYLTITNRMRMWQPAAYVEQEILDFHTKGNLPGEGASFFMVGNEKSKNSYAKITGIETIYKAEPTALIERILAFLEKNQCAIDELDVVCLGMNGNANRDAVYYDLKNNLFKNLPLTSYKNLCGEYKTSTAFATWLGAQMLHHQKVPAAIQTEKFEVEKLNKVLIYNNYSNINHSLILLEAV